MKKYVRIYMYAISTLFLISGSNYAMIGSLRSAGRSLMPQLSRSVLSKTRSLPTRTMTTRSTIPLSKSGRLQQPVGLSQQLLSTRMWPHYSATPAMPQLSTPFFDRFRSTTHINLGTYQAELPLTRLSAEEKKELYAYFIVTPIVKTNFY